MPDTIESEIHQPDEFDGAGADNGTISTGRRHENKGYADEL
jgi:hypothetical protein